MKNVLNKIKKTSLINNIYYKKGDYVAFIETDIKWLNNELLTIKLIETPNALCLSDDNKVEEFVKGKTGATATFYFPKDKFPNYIAMASKRNISEIMLTVLKTSEIDEAIIDFITNMIKIHGFLIGAGY